MKKTKLALIFLALVFLLTPIFEANAKPITLRWVSFLPGPHPSTKIYKIFTDKVNEMANGELVMKVAGGPEVIKSMDLAMSVKKNLSDLLKRVSKKTKFDELKEWKQFTNQSKKK